MKRRSLPLITLGFSGIAVLTYLIPGATEALAYDRGSIAGGSWWRVFSGHLTHWTGDHLLWDVLMFVVLGGLIERSVKPGALLATLTVSAVAISSGLWILQPEFEQYRGLSGVDSALFAFAGLWLFREARDRRQLPLRLAIVGLAGGFVTKLAWELATGTTVFVDSAGGGFVPLPSVHMVGAAAGALMFGITCTRATPARKPHIASTGRLPNLTQSRAQ